MRRFETINLHHTKYKIIMFEKLYKRLAILLMLYIYITNEIK